MQFHTEFQYDPAQDRRAARTGQEWVEFIVCAFVCLEETGTTAPARCLDAVVPISSSCTGLQTSYTVRTVGPDLPEFLVTISEFLHYKLVLTHIQ